jgi:hypothetical protein
MKQQLSGYALGYVMFPPRNLRDGLTKPSKRNTRQSVLPFTSTEKPRISQDQKIFVTKDPEQENGWEKDNTESSDEKLGGEICSTRQKRK